MRSALEPARPRAGGACFCAIHGLPGRGRPAPPEAGGTPGMRSRFGAGPTRAGGACFCRYSRSAGRGRPAPPRQGERLVCVPLWSRPDPAVALVSAAIHGLPGRGRPGSTEAGGAPGMRSRFGAGPTPGRWRSFLPLFTVCRGEPPPRRRFRRRQGYGRCGKLFEVAPTPEEPFRLETPRPRGVPAAYQLCSTRDRRSGSVMICDCLLTVATLRRRS